MKSLAILHEGNTKSSHDNDLITLLMQHLELDVSLVDFYGMGSKSNFFKIEGVCYKTLLPRINAGQVKKVLFIVDADDEKNDKVYGGTENTRRELQAFIKELSIEAISRIYIMCDPETQTGYLESFILSSIPEQQRSCIEQFLSCSQFKSKENHKAILHQIYNLAYPDAPYDFAHPNFDHLKAELTQLFEHEA